MIVTKTNARCFAELEHISGVHNVTGQSEALHDIPCRTTRPERLSIRANKAIRSFYTSIPLANVFRLFQCKNSSVRPKSKISVGGGPRVRLLYLPALLQFGTLKVLFSRKDRATDREVSDPLPTMSTRWPARSKGTRYCEVCITRPLKVSRPGATVSYCQTSLNQLITFMLSNTGYEYTA
jgi:hypothetical protein